MYVVQNLPILLSVQIWWQIFKSLVVAVTKYYYSRNVRHCTNTTGSTVVESRKRGTGRRVCYTHRAFPLQEWAKEHLLYRVCFQYFEWYTLQSTNCKRTNLQTCTGSVLQLLSSITTPQDAHTRLVLHVAEWLTASLYQYQCSREVSDMSWLYNLWYSLYK